MSFSIFLKSCIKQYWNQNEEFFARLHHVSDKNFQDIKSYISDRKYSTYSEFNLYIVPTSNFNINKRQVFTEKKIKQTEKQQICTLKGCDNKITKKFVNCIQILLVHYTRFI